MRRSSSPISNWTVGLIVGWAALTGHAQDTGGVQQVTTDDGKQQLIPLRAVDFKPVDTDPGFSLPATTVDYPHCLSDGSLVLRSIDWEALNHRPKGAFPKYNQTVFIVKGKKVESFTSSSIAGLTDFDVLDIFPAEAGIYSLVQGTKEQRGERGPGKSPAGIPLKAYRNFVAHFDLDGSFKDVTELGVKCDLSQPGSCELRHFAVFPSGDILVTESDPETSTLKLLYLNSSGEVEKQIDIPASRTPMDWGDASSNPELRRAAAMYLSSVFFTAVGENIVAWRANSSDPVVEVRQGGGVREVPIEIPVGWQFADMIASNDRWVVHFRNENTPPNVPMKSDADAYYEVRAQDGSLVDKIVQKGEAPLSIACENNGTYTSFKMNDAGKMLLLEGN